MLRNQDITIPYGDSRRVEWDIDDVIDGVVQGPAPLGGKGVRWELYPNNRAETPLLTITSDDTTLRIDEPENGIVSLDITEDESTVDIHSGRYYLRVTETNGQWTVATGNYTLTR